MRGSSLIIDINLNTVATHCPVNFSALITNICDKSVVRNICQGLDFMMLQVEARPHQVIGKIFSIVTHRTRTGSILKLEVNFPQEVVQLSKEVCVCTCMCVCMRALVHAGCVSR